MKIVFVSNFLNHHQLPLCKAFIENNIEFYFIATTHVPKSRLVLGYADMNHTYDFVICAYENAENHQKALDLCRTADVVITGSAPQIYIKDRLKNKKLTFKYSERLYKKKKPFYQMPLRAVKYFWKNGRYRNLYMLCASAYTAADYAKTATFINKTYKWGYFPEVKKYDNIDALINGKKKNTLLWAGRLIDCKHPEYAIKVAEKLKNDGYDFELNIIGSGNMEQEIKSLIADYGLEDCVRTLGSMPPEKVREYMENSEIYLFTSDRQEGWGAVLNESMNSGCAVVASHAIGSVPFLLKDGENGLIYCDGDIDNLYIKVKYLLDNPNKRAEIGKKAYETLCKDWNADNAAKKIIELAKVLLSGKKKANLFKNGVCSKAEILKDGWYK